MIDPSLPGGVIAVVRLPEAVDLQTLAQALSAGGVTAVEITLTTPGAVASLGALTAKGGVPGCLVGAGTVLEEKSARAVIAAGAQFVVSPTLEPGVIRCCRDHHVPCVPGALSPTELLAAWRAGASLVKLFPASAVGPRYLREVLAPLPSLRIVPSGGVSLETAGDWIRAGAAAISVGTALVSAPLLRDAAWAQLTARARAYVDAVADARRQMAAAPP